MRVQEFATLSEMVEATAPMVLEAARDAVSLRGRFLWCLAGGETPRPLYARLVEDPYLTEFPWEATYLFWGDERCVPPEHSESNFRMVLDAMISKAPIPGENVKPIPAAHPIPRKAAESYERTLKVFFPTQEYPEFDLTLLGMGADGHTASLFPGDRALEEPFRWVMPVQAPPNYSIRDRITLALGTLNASRRVFVLVAGPDKASVVSSILNKEASSMDLPAGRIHPSGEVDWVVASEK